MSIDTCAGIAVIRDPARPGWLCITVDRARGTRRLWLAEDEAAMVLAALTREVSPVTVSRTRRGGRS